MQCLSRTGHTPIMLPGRCSDLSIHVIECCVLSQHCCDLSELSTNDCISGAQRQAKFDLRKPKGNPVSWRTSQACSLQDSEQEEGLRASGDPQGCAQTSSCCRTCRLRRQRDTSWFCSLTSSFRAQFATWSWNHWISSSLSSGVTLAVVSEAQWPRCPRCSCTGCFPEWVKEFVSLGTNREGCDARR